MVLDTVKPLVDAWDALILGLSGLGNITVSQCALVVRPMGSRWSLLMVPAFMMGPGMVPALMVGPGMEY